MSAEQIKEEASSADEPSEDEPSADEQSSDDTDADGPSADDMSAQELNEANAEEESSRNGKTGKNGDGAGSKKRDSSGRGGKKLIAAPTDIICGRGIHIANHRGNLDLHLMVNNYRDAYLASRRPEKTKIIKHVLKEMEKTGARFIKKVSADGSTVDSWEQVDYATAYKKVSHALRLRTANESNGKSISASEALHAQNDAYGEPNIRIPRQAALPSVHHDPLSLSGHLHAPSRSMPFLHHDPPSFSGQLHAPGRSAPLDPLSLSGHLHAPTQSASVLQHDSLSLPSHLRAPGRSPSLPLSSQLGAPSGLAAHHSFGQLHGPTGIPSGIPGGIPSHPPSSLLHAASGIPSHTPAPSSLLHGASGIPSRTPAAASAHSLHLSEPPSAAAPLGGGDLPLNQIYREVYLKTLYALQQQQEEQSGKTPGRLPER